MSIDAEPFLSPHLEFVPHTYESTCHRIKLRSGSVERARQWARELAERHEEVLASLRDERVIVESVFLERTAEADFLIIYMRAPDMKFAREAGKKSEHAVDAIHRQFKRDTWVSGQALEKLFDIDRVEEVARNR